MTLVLQSVLSSKAPQVGPTAFCLSCLHKRRGVRCVHEDRITCEPVCGRFFFCMTNLTGPSDRKTIRGSDSVWTLSFVWCIASVTTWLKTAGVDTNEIERSTLFSSEANFCRAAQKQNYVGANRRTQRRLETRSLRPLGAIVFSRGMKISDPH